MPARKKTAKKTASKSRAASKETASKSTPSKKTPLKKSASRKSPAKKSPAKKSAVKKKSAQKTASKKSVKKAVKKATNKNAKKTVKKAIKKSAPISAATASRPLKKVAAKTGKAKTPGIEPKESAPKKSTALKAAPEELIWPTIDIAATATATNDAGADAGVPVERGLEAATVVMNFTITFFNGVGRASFEHSRAGNPLNTINVSNSSKVKFDDVRRNDVVTITGDCADRAELFSDRNTSEPTQPESPLKYNRVIDEILIIQ